MVKMEYCKGCYCEDNYCELLYMFIDKLTDFGVCPCSICLVKVICTNAYGCEDYVTFYQDIKNNRKKGFR